MGEIRMKHGLELAICLIVLAAPLQQVAAAPAPDSIVRTTYGQFSGHKDPHSSVTVFRGIPFAAPPVGALRWRPPVASAPWKGVRKADEFAASCMQSVHGDFLPWTKEFLVQGQTSEDCLYLNVWTPRPSATADLPVVVFIHGGGFSEGSGSIPLYDGTNLAGTGLVVVTINYRMGVFGFLAHPDLTAESSHHASGNYGFMDQIAALRWVQSNIRAFGGDPRRVTIWGQSAGAFSVGALLVSPEAKGLFQHAIADSGLGIAGLPMHGLSDAEEVGVQFASSHHAHSIGELRALPAGDLLPRPGDYSGPRFGPDVDGWILPQSPGELAAHGVGSEVPVITGYQANDGMLSGPPIHALSDYAAMAHRLYGSMADEYLTLYPAQSEDKIAAASLEASRDRERASAYLWATQRLKNYKVPVYTYYFDRAIPWPQHPEFGAFHSGELPYFFRNLAALDRPWEPDDSQVSDTASSYLREFAKSGNPNGPRTPLWPAVDPAHPAVMEIGVRTGPVPLDTSMRFAFWIRYFNSPESKNAPLF
jgi:para-nitrobenzyl esterase